MGGEKRPVFNSRNFGALASLNRARKDVPVEERAMHVRSGPKMREARFIGMVTGSSVTGAPAGRGRETGWILVLSGGTGVAMKRIESTT
jgi:hypothetical protein